MLMTATISRIPITPTAMMVFLGNAGLELTFLLFLGLSFLLILEFLRNSISSLVSFVIVTNVPGLLQETIYGLGHLHDVLLAGVELLDGLVNQSCGIGEGQVLG